MYIKPQHENPKPKQKLENQLDPALLSRDYLLEKGKMTILPVDFVIEHGKNFDDEDINRDNILGDYKCYPDGRYFSGLLYELYINDTLAYYSFHENGIENGITIRFYPSGEIHSYCVYKKGRPVRESYEWYETGEIKVYKSCYRRGYCMKCTEYDQAGNITKCIDRTKKASAQLYRCE